MSVQGQRTILYRFSRESFVIAIFLAGLSVILQTTTTYAQQPASLVAPNLVAPANASWARSSSQTFTWNVVENADSYAIRLSKNTSCTEEAFVTPETQTHVTIEPVKLVDDLSDGVWCWQVQAVNLTASGVERGPWSQIFSVSIDTEAPAVTVSEPHVAPGFNGTVNSTGLALSVLINGAVRSDIPVTLSQTPNEHGTYNWHITIPELEAGTHMLGLRAVDQAGNESIGYADFHLVAPIKPQSGINPALTEAATLPLVETGPLVFIAPPIPVAITEPNNILPYTTARTASQLITPAQIAKPEEAVKAASVSDGAVQASGEGWKLFGVAWYWWLVALVAMCVAAWRIKSLFVVSQPSGLNEPRTVY